MKNFLFFNNKSLYRNHYYLYNRLNRFINTLIVDNDDKYKNDKNDKIKKLNTKIEKNENKNNDNKIWKCPLNGIIGIYKPKGWYCTPLLKKIKINLSKEYYNKINDKYDIANIIGRTKIFKNIKIGHGGTLDHLAEGVLIIGFGNGCGKLNEYLKGSKIYEVTGKFGYETETLDQEGKIINEKTYEHMNKELFLLNLNKFKGKVTQVPPMYSALHHKGKRLYKLARKGLIVNRKPRIRELYNLELLEWDLNNNDYHFKLKLECEGGFYVRTFISDLGKSCNTLANIIDLKRIKHGNINIDQCILKWDLDTIEKNIIKDI